MVVVVWGGGKKKRKVYEVSFFCFRLLFFFFFFPLSSLSHRERVVRDDVDRGLRDLEAEGLVGVFEVELRGRRGREFWF